MICAFFAQKETPWNVMLLVLCTLVNTSPPVLRASQKA